MTVATGARIGAIVFVASILQVSVFSSFMVGAGPDVLLVVLVAIAILRGSTTGAVAGFCAGLIVDVATLGTLGVTSLVLTLVCFWVGRYGETTGQGRAHALIAATVAATIFAGLGGYALHLMLFEPVAPRVVLIAVSSAVLWNAVLAYPVFALVRRIVGQSERATRTREVELLV